MVEQDPQTGCSECLHTQGVLSCFLPQIWESWRAIETETMLLVHVKILTGAETY